MFLGVLLKEGSYFHLLLEKLTKQHVLLPKKPKT